MQGRFVHLVGLSAWCLLPLAACGRVGFAHENDAHLPDGSLRDGSPARDARALFDGAVTFDASADGSAPQADAAPTDAIVSADAPPGTPDGAALGCFAGTPEVRFVGYDCEGTCNSSSGIVHLYYASFGYTGRIRIQVTREPGSIPAHDLMVDACVGDVAFSVMTSNYLARMTAIDDASLTDTLPFDVRVD